VKITKLQVKDEREESCVPFLRGILTRSLSRVGVSFDLAYGIATDVRDELASENTITTSELRSLVHSHLVSDGLDDEAQRYLVAALKDIPTLIYDSDNSPRPFSKGLLVQSLEICAIDRDSAYRVAASVEQHLPTGADVHITTRLIEELTAAEITLLEGPELAERYRMWLAFTRSGRPLILLIGGTTGVGKSTFAAELSHRLNIVRSQSTDMLREVMRLMIPSELLPTLHTSSFEAYDVMPHLIAESDSQTPSSSMIAGYLTQSEHVRLAMDGVLKRAENERVSLILEGVHIHPDIQNRIESASKGLVIPMLLSVLKKKLLKKHLVGRGQQVSSRRSERYVKYFDRIWDLQSFLLSEADTYNVPIIFGNDNEGVRVLAMQTIAEYVRKDALEGGFEWGASN
jgi:2-phosphoglycerate kinase